MNELLCSREIVNRHFDRKDYVYQRRVEKLCDNFSWKRKLWLSLLSLYYNIDAYLCNVRIELRWNEFFFWFVKIMNQYFERKESSVSG